MKKRYELMALTNQLVSQLLYCSSRLPNDNFNEVSQDILKLICSYRKKTKELQKQNRPE
jgi:hypothetical protein